MNLRDESEKNIRCKGAASLYKLRERKPHAAAAEARRDEWMTATKVL